MYGDTELGTELIPGVAPKNLDRIVLRANFNDRLGAYNPSSSDLRDEVLRKLHHDMGAVVSSGTWCLLYVDGEARGLYNVVERIDEGFLKRHFGGKDWDMIKTGEAVVCGKRDDWDALKKFLLKADLSSPATFEKLKEWVDVPSFTAYMVLNLWSQNEDWPQNNWYAARERREGAKWIFLCWDAEWGMGHTPTGWAADSFKTLFDKTGVIRGLLFALFKDPEYRKSFRADVERYLSGALSPENVAKRVNEEEARVAPFMPLELRVNAQGFSERDWRNNVEILRVFGANRKAKFLQLTERALEKP